MLFGSSDLKAGGSFTGQVFYPFVQGLHQELPLCPKVVDN